MMCLRVFLIFFLAVGLPAVGFSSAQIYGISSDTTGLVDNAIDDSNVTGNIKESPFVSDTETSRLDAASVVINEVELNPQGSDDGREWIELYNPSNVGANVSDFEIRTSFKSATVQLPSYAVIGANGTYIIEFDRQMLSNTAESLVLANGSSWIIDATPPLIDKNDDSRTWQRIPDGNNEWQFTSGTRDELNDPDGQAGTTYAARSHSAAECQGTAGCAEGIVKRIVDGDTLYVAVNSTVYKIDLALASAPSSTEQGYSESTSFTRSLCLGSIVLVDQDDKLLTSETSIIAVVYCASANLNSELLDNGYATLDMDQCKTSEFASQDWAKEHGC